MSKASSACSQARGETADLAEAAIPAAEREMESEREREREREVVSSGHQGKRDHSIANRDVPGSIAAASLAVDERANHNQQGPLL
mmetsp:Transcript_38073/g.80627  ORF Transcript_38073/g.80627 Transcript_38073/m.80627 type:complete len:85 (+) Transcript_38073:174-428(+)